MPDILSSDELSSLLAAVDESGGQDTTFFRDKTVTPYDFERPTRLSRSQVRQLQRLYESALEGLTGALSEALRTYSGVLALDIPFCLALVDRLLGGHGHTTEKPRSLTSIEIAVLDWPVKMILEQLQQCWRSAPEVRFVGETIRMDLNFVQIMHTAETVLWVTFALGGEIGSGEAHFCVPFAALERANCLEQLREEALGGSGEPDEQTKAQARENLKKASLELRAELGSTTLTVREVMGLKPGQAIRLSNRVGEPIPVKVGEKVKFRAQPGLRARTLAIQIHDVVKD